MIVYFMPARATLECLRSRARGRVVSTSLVLSVSIIGAGCQVQAPLNSDANQKTLSGVVGNTLCLNADVGKDRNISAHIQRIFGEGAVESPSDAVYSPPRAHVLAATSDPTVGAYISIIAIEPTDVNQDMVSIRDGGDRSRTEIKVAPAKGGMHESFKAREGETFTYAWRFRISPEMRFAPTFTHLHQIKAYGGAFSDPPLITFTPIADGKSSRLEVRHIGNAVKTGADATRLGELPLSEVVGMWLDVREEITFSNKVGRYKLTLRDVTGKLKLSIDRSNLALWRTGAEHMRPKWGIYRKHHPSLNQHVEDRVDFANIGVTRGSAPSSSCQ
jgi:hypothetical protein